MTSSSHDAANRQQLAQQLESTFYQDHPLGQLRKTLVNFVLSLFTLSIEVLFRHNFGERYLRLPVLFMSAVLYWFLSIGFGQILGSIFRSTPGTELVSGEKLYFVLLFVGAGLFHRYRIFRRNWYTGPEWHSYASGDSWLQPLFSQQRGRLPFMVPVNDFTQRYAEPLLAIFIGAFIGAIGSSFLGWWLMIAGFTLALKEATKHQTIRDNYLSLVDAQIESTATTELLKHGWVDIEEGQDAAPATAQRHRGYTAFIPLPTRTEEQRKNAAVTMQAIYPAEMKAAEEEAAPSKWQQAKAQQKAGSSPDSSAN